MDHCTHISGLALCMHIHTTVYQDIFFVVEINLIMCQLTSFFSFSSCCLSCINACSLVAMHCCFVCSSRAFSCCACCSRLLLIYKLHSSSIVIQQLHCCTTAPLLHISSIVIQQLHCYTAAPLLHIGSIVTQ